MSKSDNVIPINIVRAKPPLFNPKIEVHNTDNSLQNLSKTSHFLLQKPHFFLNKLNFPSINHIICYKYLEITKEFLLVNEHFELFYHKKKNSIKLCEILIKSRVICMEFLRNFDNSLLLIGHINGFLSIYELNNSFSSIKLKKKLIIFKTFAIDLISFDEKSHFVVIGSFETNKILVYQYSVLKNDLELVYLIRRNDLGLFRAIIFIDFDEKLNKIFNDEKLNENMNEKLNGKLIEKLNEKLNENINENLNKAKKLTKNTGKNTIILISSTVCKLHIFNTSKRENHEFFLTTEPIIALERANFLENDTLILGASLKNSVFLWNFERKELIFFIENNENFDNPLYNIQIKSLNIDNYWLKLLIFSDNLTPFRIELWSADKKSRDFSLPQSLLTNAKIEINHKEILQIFYVNFLGNKQKTGQYIVTAGDDFMIRIYDIRDLSLIRIWQASHLPITSISVIKTEGDLLLASASYNNIIQIWGFFDGDIPIQSLASHSLDVNCLLFIEKASNNPSFLISGSADKTIILWGFDQMNLLKKLAQAKACETSVISLEYLRINDKEQYLAVGSRDKNIKIFSLPKLQFLRDLIGHKDSVKSLLKFHRPKSFFSLFYNEKLLDSFYNQNIYINANDMIKSSETPLSKSETFNNAFFDEKIEIFLISGSMDKTIKIWDIFNGICLYTVHGHEGYINALIWLDEDMGISNRMASASQDGKIKIWDMVNLVCLETFSVDFPRFSSGICYVKEENLLIFTNYKGDIILRRLGLETKMEVGKEGIMMMRSGKIEVVQGENLNGGKNCCLF